LNTDVLDHDGAGAFVLCVHGKCGAVDRQPFLAGNFNFVALCGFHPFWMRLVGLFRLALGLIDRWFDLRLPLFAFESVDLISQLLNLLLELIVFGRLLLDCIQERLEYVLQWIKRKLSQKIDR